jgi:hypothetical protein
MGIDKDRNRKVKDFFHKVSFNIVKMEKDLKSQKILQKKRRK